MITELLFFAFSVFALKKFCIKRNNKLGKNNTRLRESLLTLSKAVEVIKNNHEQF